MNTPGLFDACTYTVWIRLIATPRTWTIYASGVATVDDAMTLLGGAITSGTGAIGGVILPTGMEP